MNRKNLLITSAAAMLLLAGCGGSNPTPAETSSSETPSSVPASSAEDTSSGEKESSQAESVSSAEEGSSSEESASSEEASDSSEESSSSEEVVKHSITVDAPDFLVVEVVEEAEVGATVVFTAIEKEPDTYDVLRVKVNDGYATKAEDGTWSFVMPDEDVVLVPEYAEVVPHEVTLSAMVDVESVTVTGLGSFKRGAEVVVGVTLLNDGYEIKAVRIVGTETNLYDATTGNATFVMPDHDVTLTVDLEGKLFALSLADASLPIDITADRLPLVEGKAEYGASINVSLRSADPYFKAHRPIALVEQGSDPEVRYEVSNYAANFVMPAREVVLDLICEDITFDMTLAESEHIALGLFSKVDDEYVAKTENKAAVGDEVYVQAKNSASDSYDMTSLKVSYQTGDYYQPTGTIDLLDGAHQEGDYFHFTFPSIKEGTALTIQVEEAEMAYAGAAFLGSYLGINVVSNNYGSSSFNLFYSVSIDATGAITDGYGDSVGQVTEDLGSAFTMTVGETNNNVLCDGNMILAPAGFGGGEIGPDFVVAFKKENPTDSNDDYAIRYERFQGNSYLAVEFLKKDEESGEFKVSQTLFFDSTNANLYTDVEFVFTTGAYVNDSVVAYDVVLNDEVLYSVYSDGTGPSSRKLLDGNQGDYEGSIAEATTSIHVDGKGGLIFGNEEIVHPYTLDDDGHLIVSVDSDEGTTTYTFTLDKKEKTFTVETSFEPKEEGSLAFIGHTYSYSGSKYRVEVSFVDEDTLNGVAYSQKTSKIVNDYTFSGASYAVNGTTIVVSATSTYSGSGTLTLTYDEAEDKFTVDAVIGNLFKGSESLGVAVGGTFTLKA